MLLWEFENALVTKIVTVSDQLKSDLDSGKIQGNWTLDQLLNYFQDYDIILDPDDLYNMIQKDPLKNVIANIQGDDVIFKGNETPDVPTDKNQNTVKQMAQRATKL
jgi:hypothetical protein